MSRALLVIEVKTELTSIEAALRKHDEKVRLAPAVVQRRFEWRPHVVARLLVLPDQSTQRRRVAAHAAILDRAYPSRTAAVRRWCRRPVGEMAGLMFLSDPATSRTTTNRGRRERVRLARAGSIERGAAPAGRRRRAGMGPDLCSARVSGI